MAVPLAIWVVFLFALGASIGSFLNVVVYRLPRDISLVKPGSHCTSCGHALAWYDNLPVIAWFLLRGKCRYCGQKYSFRYPLVELFTGLLFVGMFLAYFVWRVRPSMPMWENGGWLIYAAHMALISGLLASSLIDQEHWIIPLSISYTIAVIGTIIAVIAPYVLPVAANELWRITPFVGPRAAAVGLGGGVGLLIGLLLLHLDVLKRSFAEWEAEMAKLEEAEKNKKVDPKIADVRGPGGPVPLEPIPVNIRKEMLREILFLLPAILLAWLAHWLLTGDGPLASTWSRFLQEKWAAGLLGSLFGFIIGGTAVWATRILGSLLFGREAMGLGDVHLMAAVGAVLGWISPLVAFFVAPFLGLGWAVARLIWQRVREIWYGPFLSIATVIVMLYHDRIVAHFAAVFSGLAWP